MQRDHQVRHLDGYDKDIWSDGGQSWLRANYSPNEHSWYDESWVHESPVPTLQDMVYRLFQYGLGSWGAFSTTRYKNDNSVKEGDNAKNAMSLEFIHNNVHVSDFPSSIEAKAKQYRTGWEEHNSFALKRRTYTSGALAT